MLQLCVTLLYFRMYESALSFLFCPYFDQFEASDRFEKMGFINITSSKRMQDLASLGSLRKIDTSFFSFNGNYFCWVLWMYAWINLT